MRTHWRHLANMIERVISSAYPSRQPKRQIGRSSHFCTAHGRASSGIPAGMSFPLINKRPLRIGIWAPYRTCFVEPNRVYNTNGISIGSAVHAQLAADSPILYNGPFPQNCIFPWGLWTHLTRCSLGPPEYSTQTTSRSVQPFLQGSLL